MPKTIIRINGAFTNCKALSKVIIKSPKNNFTIHRHSFDDCSNLKNICVLEDGEGGWHEYNKICGIPVKIIPATRTMVVKTATAKSIAVGK
jgi:hypothetical protein